MSPDRLDQVKEILSEALGLPAGDRAAFIDHASRGDEEVRIEALRLVHVGERMGGFLSRPLVEAEPVDEPGSLSGENLKDRYVLGRFVGRGGYGDVYEARDTVLNGRRVAVKVLHQGVLSGEHLLREIEVLASLDHPGIVAALDAGVFACGRSCLVMRWVEGPTLRKLIREGRRFSDDFIGRLSHQLSSALGAAHAAGVLHLDLKPDNIIVVNHEEPDAYAVILDFGVGRIARSDQTPDALVGHRGSRYSAPELRNGRPQAASDFYALGVILLELLTGKERPGAVDIVEAPAAWRKLLAALLQPDPEKRISSSAQVAAAIPGQYRERLLWASAAAAIVLAAVSGLFWARPEHSAFIPSPVPFTSLPDEESFPHLSEDGSRVYFSWAQGTNNPDIYVKLVGAPEPLQLTDHPARETHAASSPDGTHLAFLRDHGDAKVDLVLMPSEGGAGRILGTRHFNSIAWSRDGRFLAASVTDVRGGQLRIELLDLSTLQWRLLVPIEREIRGDLHPSFSPDGTQLVFARRIAVNDAAVAVISLDENLQATGEPRLLVRGLMNLVTPQWTPDGKTILYLAGPASNRTLWTVPEDGSAAPVREPEAGDRLDQISTSVSQWRFVVSRSMEDFNIWRAQVSPGNPKTFETHPIVPNTWNDEEARISPNGRWLAFVSHRTGNEQIWVSQVDGRRPERVTSFADADNLQVLWSPDSTRLLITGNIGRGRRTLLYEYPGGKTSDAPLTERDLACGWSRDGRHIYYLAESVEGGQLWRKPIDGGLAHVVSKMPATRAIESLDGGTVYFCTRQYSDGVFSVPVNGGTETRVVPSIEARSFSVGEKGLYYVSGRSNPVIRFSPFRGGAPSDLLQLPRRSGFGFDVSPSGQTIVYTLLDYAGADLSLFDGYRF